MRASVCLHFSLFPPPNLLSGHDFYMVYNLIICCAATPCLLSIYENLSFLTRVNEKPSLAISSWPSSPWQASVTEHPLRDAFPRRAAVQDSHTHVCFSWFYVSLQSSLCSQSPGPSSPLWIPLLCSSSHSTHEDVTQCQVRAALGLKPSYFT